MANEAEGVGPTVLPSSTELFYFYGQTLDQCAKYTNGEAMAKLSQVFGKYLKVYCGMSRTRLCFTFQLEHARAEVQMMS
jgi:hypothetical protein